MISQEVRIIQPATAKFLSENGFSYDREVKMPTYGRADFVAQKDGVTYIIECKDGADALKERSIRQLMGYVSQITGSRAVFAIDRELLSPTISDVCQRDGIYLWLLDINRETRDRVYSQRIARNLDLEMNLHYILTVNKANRVSAWIKTIDGMTIMNAMYGIAKDVPFTSISRKLKITVKQVEDIEWFSKLDRG